MPYNVLFCVVLETSLWERGRYKKLMILWFQSHYRITTPFQKHKRHSGEISRRLISLSLQVWIRRLSRSGGGRLTAELPVGSAVKNLPANAGDTKCRFCLWVQKIPWRRKWQLTSVLLPGESHGPRSLVGCSLWGRKESDTTQGLNGSRLTTSPPPPGFPRMVSHPLTMMVWGFSTGSFQLWSLRRSSPDTPQFTAHHSHMS